MTKKTKFSYTEKNHQKNGFTMIELLVVIVILGILSMIGLGSFSSSQMKARDSKRKTDLRAISDALELYYNDYRSYPTSNAGFIVGCRSMSGNDVCVAGQIWKNSENGTTYMVKIPEDPNGGTYYYITSDGTYYQLYAHLENPKDRDIPLNGSGEQTYYLNPEKDSGSCVTGACNYGRSSTNTDLGPLY